MASKYYVVWAGRKPGIYRTWAACKEQTDKFPCAKYKSFKTLEEAESEFHGKKNHTTSANTNTASNKSTIPTQKSSNQNIKTYTAEEISSLPLDIKVFTDGACEPNPGEAGSGIAIYKNNVIDTLWYGCYNPKGTNNTAELEALYQAQLIAEDEINKGKTVAIFCDSQYCVKSITLWATGWKNKGWKNKGKDVANLNLIQPMYELHQKIQSKVDILHVNGHVGVEGNELADRMSILAIERQETEFSLYREAIDIQSLLSMRRG